MRRLLLVALILSFAGSAFAELQNIMVGGELRIRGRYFRNGVTTLIGREQRFPATTVPERALGLFGLTSVYDADDRGTDRTFVEQRTVLNVTANFTDDVSAFIELESFGFWGETNALGNEFRSNYLTGVDSRAWTGDDVEVFQAYIDAKEILGYPVSLRVGRQELVFGESWLVGSRVSPTLGISYDGVRATYAHDDFTVDAWWTKLAERFDDFADDDIDFYAVWGTYKGIEKLTIEMYYLLLHDGTDISLTNRGLLWEWLEGLADLDNYESTNVQTLGLHLDGKAANFDYDLQLAYQWGRATPYLQNPATGAFTLYTQTPFLLYADDSAEYDAYAADFEVGYTFADAKVKPRVYIGGAYFSGDDNRDISFWDWLNPFDKPEPSLSFNRIFSGVWYSANFDILGGASALTNFHQLRTGVSLELTPAVSTGLSLAYFGINEPFDWPAGFRLGGYHVPYAANLSFWTEEAADDIGYTAHAWLMYKYSKDWWIKIGWERLFTGDGVRDGSFVLKNGHELLAGTDDDEMDYVYFDTQLKF